jgi:uncharacterized phage protein (TIGR01671 family)
MREIKFKAKTCNSEWVEGLLAHKDNKWYISNKVGMSFAFEVRPETISQYTGLKDKKGKEIYEGDILRGEFYGYPFDCIETFTVKWHKADAGFLANYFNNAKCEVIGNIFDNPELLERGAE